MLGISLFIFFLCLLVLLVDPSLICEKVILQLIILADEVEHLKNTGLINHYIVFGLRIMIHDHSITFNCYSMSHLVIL